ncbi:MAG: AtpZ/AtpI family protein [Rhodospirillales bacterium]|nr:AtpZ/AtpI family protein [Rhodospirillales bacterium]
MGDLDDLESKINQFKSGQKSDDRDDQKEYDDRSTGMRAGSEFIAYIISGGLVGWGIGHFLGNMALWLILMMFIGFGMGIWRASQLMK